MFKLRSLNALRNKRTRISVNDRVWTIRATRSNGDMLLTHGTGRRREDVIYSPSLTV